MDNATPNPAVTVISFGFERQSHGIAPEADLVLDARRYLRDPARMRARALLDNDGRHPAVRRIVLDTPGAHQALAVMAAFARTFPAGKPCTIAVGCVGGKHRSVALAHELARELRRAGLTVTLEHRHAHLPRILREPVPAAG